GEEPTLLSNQFHSLRREKANRRRKLAQTPVLNRRGRLEMLWNNSRPDMPQNPNLARDHLANERTLLAWVRTGVAIVVFGFAIGRFGIAIRQFSMLKGGSLHSSGMSVWFGLVAIFGGVILTIAGLVRYRMVRAQLDRGEFRAAGLVIDIFALLTAVFGLVLGAYLFYIQKTL